MKTGLSLRDLAAKLETEKHQKKDMIVNTGSTELVVFNGDLHLDAQDNGGGLYSLRPLAHDQLAEHVDVPLGPAVGLTEKEEGSILNALIRGGDVSAWGLLNAVTFQANTETDYDRAVELETAGGKLLALPAPEWSKILNAE